MKRKSHSEHYREEFALKVQVSTENREIFFHRQTGNEQPLLGLDQPVPGNCKVLFVNY